MPPIVSILITTRKRTEMLVNLLMSLKRTASSSQNYEAIVRFSSDDAKSYFELFLHPEFKSFSDNLTVIIGYPMEGFNSLGQFCSELAEHANGKWDWFVSDDCVLDGMGWDLKFDKFPMDGVVVYPGIDRLDSSSYNKCAAGPFPAVPHKSWKKMGREILGNPPDRDIYQLYCLKHKWKPVFLNGITMIHERGKAKLHDSQQ